MGIQGGLPFIIMIKLLGRDLNTSLTEREQFLKSLPRTEVSSVLLHTCNRTEVYSGTGDVPADVAHHLFRVACGLESALPGETAIQGQVRDAYEKAKGAARLSRGLHRLFQRALRAGKRVRSETNISRGAMSHSKAVLEMLREDRVDVANAKILVIGVSHLNMSVVKYLVEKGGRTIFVANRTYPKAAALAQKYGCEAMPFADLREKLKEADILISATSAPHLIVRRQDFTASKPCVMFDLVVPRDIDPAIGLLPRVTLYNIEDIEKRLKCNKTRRLEEILKAEQIIEEEIKEFYENT